MRRVWMLFTLAAAAPMSLCADAAAGTATGEQLRAAAPANWQKVHGLERPTLRIAEYTPPDQSPWRDKVRFESFRNEPAPSPAPWLEALAAEQRNTCATFEHHAIFSGRENGYATAIGLLSCEGSRSSGGAQTSLVKAIAGERWFYVVTRARRGSEAVTEQDMVGWISHMRDIHVCHPGTEAHPCAPDNGP